MEKIKINELYEQANIKKVLNKELFDEEKNRDFEEFMNQEIAFEYVWKHSFLIALSMVILITLASGIWVLKIEFGDMSVIREELGKWIITNKRYFIGTLDLFIVFSMFLLVLVNVQNNQIKVSGLKKRIFMLLNVIFLTEIIRKSKLKLFKKMIKIIDIQEEKLGINKLRLEIPERPNKKPFIYNILKFLLIYGVFLSGSLYSFLNRPNTISLRIIYTLITIAPSIFLIIVITYFITSFAIAIFPRLTVEYSNNKSVEIVAKIIHVLKLLNNHDEKLLWTNKIRQDILSNLEQISRLIKNYNSNTGENDTEMRKASEYFNFNIEKVKYPMKDLKEELIKELLLYLNIFTTGELNRLPKADIEKEEKEKRVSTREKVKKQIITALMLIFPVVLIYFIESKLNIAKYDLTRKAIYIFMGVWTFYIVMKSNLFDKTEIKDYTQELFKIYRSIK